MNDKSSPEYWFLDAEQIDRTPPFTDGNLVVPLIDGQAFMSDLYTKISKMNADDYLYLTAWRMSPNERLIRDGTDQRNVTQIFQNLITYGIQVRALIWRFPGSKISEHGRGNVNFVHSINNMDRDNGQAILDNQLPNSVLSSHHQKTINLSSNNSEYAYVGGLDIAVERWDTPAHTSPPERTGKRYNAWHDVQGVVSGPSVAQIWDNFSERWNNVKQSNHKSLFTNRPKQVPESGTHSVQVLRTMPPNIYDLNLRGDQSIREAYEQAIDKAEHFIYIEDQFFWPCSIVDKLVEAASRGVKIILVLAKEASPILRPWFNHLRWQALNSLSKNHPENIFVYHVRQLKKETYIYVHSKLMIIDDRYAVFGSANINKRSMVFDPELQIAVVDRSTESGRMGSKKESTCSFAKNLRLNLWMEHLGLAEPDEIDDPIRADIGSPSGWPLACSLLESNTKHHAVCYKVPKLRWGKPEWIINGFNDPDI